MYNGKYLKVLNQCFKIFELVFQEHYPIFIYNLCNCFSFFTTFCLLLYAGTICKNDCRCWISKGRIREPCWWSCRNPFRGEVLEFFSKLMCDWLVFDLYDTRKIAQRNSIRFTMIRLSHIDTNLERWVFNVFYVSGMAMFLIF